MWANTMIATALLATSGLAVASDASYDRQQLQSGTATVTVDKSAKNDSRAAAQGSECTCQHQHKHS